MRNITGIARDMFCFLICMNLISKDENGVFVLRFSDAVLRLRVHKVHRSSMAPSVELILS